MYMYFKGTVSGVAAAETWGSRWRPKWGDMETQYPGEQMHSIRAGGWEQMGAAQWMGADGGFWLIILV